MKVRDLIKNAIVLHSEGKSQADKGLPALLKEVEFRNISSLGAYLLAQIDNEIDPMVQKIRRASEQEAGGRSALLSSIAGMSAFNKVLNVRYGVPNSILLNVDDPSLAEIIGSLPHGILKYQPLQRPVMPQFKAVLSRETTFGSYLQSMAEYVKGRHGFNKAVSETLAERERGHRFSVFSKMTFLQTEKSATFPHAVIFRPSQGMSVSVLRFSPDQDYNNPSKWHGQDMLKTYLFSHELGHCVMGDETHQMNFERFCASGDAETRVWMNEVYADTYSALFVASMTGNWDFLPLCILPERAAQEADHNTFHCLRKLPGLIRADELQRMDPQELPRITHNLMAELMGSESSVQVLKVQHCASLLYKWSLENHEASISDFENELERLAGGKHDMRWRDEVIGSFSQRIQASIDNLGVKMQMGVSPEVIKDEMLKISGVLRLPGHNGPSLQMSAMAQKSPSSMLDKYQKFMSPGAVAAGERYEETMIQIQNFWSDWRQEELSYQPKTKNPAFEGRALG